MNIFFKIARYNDNIYRTTIIKELTFPKGEYLQLNSLIKQINEFDILDIPDIYFLLLIWEPIKNKNYREFDETCWVFSNQLNITRGSVCLNGIKTKKFLLSPIDINNCFETTALNAINYLTSNYLEQLNKTKKILQEKEKLIQDLTINNDINNKIKKI